MSSGQLHVNAACSLNSAPASSGSIYFSLSDHLQGLNVRGLCPPRATSTSVGQGTAVTTRVHNPMHTVLKTLQNDSLCRKRTVSWTYVQFWNFTLMGPRTRFANVNLPALGAGALHTESDIGITHLPRTSLWSKVIFPLMKLKVEWQVGFDDYPGFILECSQPYPHDYIRVIFKAHLKTASKKTY